MEVYIFGFGSFHKNLDGDSITKGIHNIKCMLRVEVGPEIKILIYNKIFTFLVGLSRRLHEAKWDEDGFVGCDN